ncbi:hypothetical protein FQR65_LT01296 [Abscondita terminalis]|nr:hypothetical protein FQR65_LT01296 [Abscondita terminalis]
MSPIENVVPEEPTPQPNLDIRKKQDRTRDLFGIQLEVTSLLLEAERRKLSVLQKELQIALAEGGSIKAKEHQKQELLVAITRIQAQYDHLEKEYREHAIGALLSANSRGSGKVSCFTCELCNQQYAQRIDFLKKNVERFTILRVILAQGPC